MKRNMTASLRPTGLILGVVVASFLAMACAPSEEEIAEVMEAVGEHVRTIDFSRLRSYSFQGLIYSDQRNSTAPRKHWIAIKLKQDDGPRRAEDPRDMPRKYALKHPENVLIQEYCPPSALTDEHSDFGIYLSVYSTRFDERYRVACPL